MQIIVTPHKQSVMPFGLSSSTLSFRESEELLSSIDIIVSYETVCQWSKKYDSNYCKQVKKNRGELGNTWYLDEVLIIINGILHYLWRAVDQDGDEIDILGSER